MTMIARQFPIIVCLGIAFLFFESQAEAATTLSPCPQGQATSATDILVTAEVQKPGDEAFHDLDVTLCVSEDATRPPNSDLMYFILTLGIPNDTNSYNWNLDPYYPRGTKFKLTLTHTKPGWVWGAIDAQASSLRAEYSDALGGSPFELKLLIESDLIRRAGATVPGISECEQQLSIVPSQVSFRQYLVKKKSLGNGSTGANRVVAAGRATAYSSPELGYDEDQALFSYSGLLQACPQQDTESDSFFKAFFPINIFDLRSVLPVQVFRKLDDEIVALLVRPAQPNEGWTILDSFARLSYGQSSNLSGIAISANPTGFYIELRANNTGALASSLHERKTPTRAAEQEASMVVYRGRLLLTKCSGQCAPGHIDQKVTRTFRVVTKGATIFVLDKNGVSIAKNKRRTLTYQTKNERVTISKRSPLQAFVSVASLRAQPATIYDAVYEYSGRIKLAKKLS